MSVFLPKQPSPIQALQRTRLHVTAPASMRLLRLRLFHIAIICLAQNITQAADPKPDAASTKVPLASSEQEVTLELIKTSAGTSNHFRLTNNSTRTIYCFGYEKHPWCWMRIQTHAGWEDRESGFLCGNGIGAWPVWPKSSIAFDASYIHPGTQPYQVELSYFLAQNFTASDFNGPRLTVWTTPAVGDEKPPAAPELEPQIVVIGHSLKQAVIPFLEGLTASQAILESGSTNEFSVGSVHLIRNGQITNVALRDIFDAEHPEKDIFLKAWDIIQVR